MPCPSLRLDPAMEQAYSEEEERRDRSAAHGIERQFRLLAEAILSGSYLSYPTQLPSLELSYPRLAPIRGPAPCGEEGEGCQSSVVLVNPCPPHLSGGSQRVPPSCFPLLPPIRHPSRTALLNYKESQHVGGYYLALLLNLFCCIATAERVVLKPALESFFGCAFLLQSWFPAFINVGGVLWQIAVFAFGYAIFPFVSRAAHPLGLQALLCGMLSLYIFSAGYFLYRCIAAIVENPDGSNGGMMSVMMGAWVWHVHCIARLPQFVAGVCLGEVLERLRISRSYLSSYQYITVSAFEPQNEGNASAAENWGICADSLSVLLLGTALISPLARALFGTNARDLLSIAYEAFLLPLHALWLVLFVYTMVVAYMSTGDWRLTKSIDDVDLRVRASWFHMPLQWALVLLVSLAANRLFEQPLRKWIMRPSRHGAQHRSSTASGREDEEEGKRINDPTQQAYGPGEERGGGKESSSLLFKLAGVGDINDDGFTADSLPGREYGTYD
eukprot:jgi/Bigna1/83276/fgenesh1_pg.105_\